MLWERKRRGNYIQIWMRTCARAAGSLIRWWTLGVSITGHPAQSGLQDKNIFTGTFVSVNDEVSVMRVCVCGGGGSRSCVLSTY